MIKFLTLFIILFPLTGFANDSAGTTSAGGITFIKSPDISMEREELTVSPTKVKVKYHFKNITAQPITGKIYFPLPLYKTQGANTTWDEEIDPEVKTRENTPFINFTVKVNDEPTRYQTLTRALFNNKDITQQLQKAQIPLNPELVAGNMPLTDADHIKQPAWLQKARSLQLVDNKQQPKWQKQIFYTWKQTFPANSTVVIEHEYRPAAGVFYSAAVPSQSSATRLTEDLKHFKMIFNIHKIKNYQQLHQFKQWLAKRIQQAMGPQRKHYQEDHIYALFFNVDYILKTGANWSGPIKDFKLNIKYPVDGSIIYNQFYGKQKITEHLTKGQRQIHIKNFMPQENLSIIFGLSRWPKDS